MDVPISKKYRVKQGYIVSDQPNIWSMAAMLRDSVAAVVVMRTRPRAVPLAMRKSVFLSYMSMGLRLAALRPAGALLKHN